MKCDSCGKPWNGKERFSTREVEHTQVRTLCEACAKREATLAREEQKTTMRSDPPPRRR